jgi:hypothetical protein
MKETQVSESISIQDVLPKVTADVAVELQKRAVERFQWAVQEAVGKQIQQYIAEKIMPEVAKELAEKDAVIRAALVAGITQACVEAGEAVRVAMTKKLSGYEGDKVIGQLLGILSPKAY